MQSKTLSPKLTTSSVTNKQLPVGRDGGCRNAGEDGAGWGMLALHLCPILAPSAWGMLWPWSKERMEHNWDADGVCCGFAGRMGVTWLVTVVRAGVCVFY